MRKLDLPEKGSVELLAEVIAERANGSNADFFANIAAEWTAQVQAFVDCGGNPEIIKEWQTSKDRPKPFLTLYNSPQEGHAQQIVLAQMRQDKLQACPSCGEDGVPNTLDHYLPKGTFPHFAVIPANLTPMCDACQAKKLEQTLDENSLRIFIHPYFDAFVERRVFRVEIGKPYESPRTFALVPVGGLGREIEALLLRHMKGLSLQERYAHFFRDMHSQLVRTVANLRAFDLNVVDHLTFFRKIEAGRGKNGWRHIFYASVLKDESLLDWLQHADLPDDVDTIPNDEE